MPGRPRKPTKLHVLQGTFRKNRHSKEELTLPQAETTTPAPYDIRRKPVALNKWKELLHSDCWGRIVTKADLPALARYCLHYARLCKAQREIAKDSEVLTDEKGKSYKNPWVMIFREASEAMHKIETQFGGMPAARGKVSVSKPKKPENPFGNLDQA